MRYRKQTQHWRRYRSGRYTFVNRGIFYKNFVRDYRWTKPSNLVEFLDRTRWASGETAPSNLRKMRMFHLKSKLINDFGFEENDIRFRGLTKEELVILYRDTFLEHLRRVKKDTL